MDDTCLQDALVIGSRFEVDASKATCRLAIYGRLAALMNPADPPQMRKLRIYKLKRRTGSIDRMNKDGLSAVCKGMFKKETDISVFVGLKVSHIECPTLTTLWAHKEHYMQVKGTSMQALGERAADI